MAAVAAEEALADFHARHSARSRSYRYRIYRRRERSPLEVRRSWWYPRRIDLDALAASADLLLGEHDFRAFTPTETQHDVFLRTVLARPRGTSAATHLDFEITADSFLRHMVRTLVGTMLERQPEEIARLLEGRVRAGGRRDRAALGPLPRRRRATEAATPIEAVRFPVGLFDLDGTLIDSGPMILASMKHAAKTCSAATFPDEVLTAAVGGPGLDAQMHALDPERVDELVAAYREHNEPLHEELEAFWEVVEVLPRLRAEGRRLGIVTAKRRATVQLAFDACPGSRRTSRSSSAPRTRAPQARSRPDPRGAGAAGRVRPRRCLRRRLPVRRRAAKAAGVYAVAVAWGGIHGAEALEREEPDVLVHHAEELLGVL